MAREYFAGMGQAVADRTINRKNENWGDVAKRVALGNANITHDDPTNLERHIANASILMSGRHLQHGDETQPGRNLEIFSNCSSSMQRSITFYLLLNGSGVGSSYDDEICIVDFRNMPIVITTIDAIHPDAGAYKSTSEMMRGHPNATVFHVPDSREGWAEAIEQIEVAAWRGHRDDVLLLDFSAVRPHGSPIMGMQGRPASGPAPLMDAVSRVATIRNSSWEPWRQAMQFDHELAECVLVGGARRSARIAVKSWKDPGIMDFINCKQEGGLWSANHSIAVDAEFWALENNPVLDAVLSAQYEHGTGEPGFLNSDKLAHGEFNPTIEDVMTLGGKYQLSDEGYELRHALAEASLKMIHPYIVNPCGEIRLHVAGAYCVIADVVPYFSESDEDACDAFREATVALLRTNLLPSLYEGEVNRTNRIGVGFTGIHEYAWSRFGFTFLDLVDERKSLPFWMMLRRFADVVEETASDWCYARGILSPATTRTVKPAGTTSKLFGLTEGVHLPPMREYLRWVMFRHDDPLVEEYKAKGYPFRELKTYSGTTIIGFPTQPLICTLDMPVTTASEATPEQQFIWLQLLEKYWLGEFGGNQISYTLKYDPKVVSYDQFKAVMTENMPKVRAVSVMPFADMTAYEYQPEQPLTAAEFEAFKVEAASEDVDQVHVDCASGACPITFNK